MRMNLCDKTWMIDQQMIKRGDVSREPFLWLMMEDSTHKIVIDDQP